MSGPQDLTHVAVEPLLAEHALGALDDVDAHRVDAHLIECAACRAEFDELVAAVAELDAAAAPATAMEPAPNATRDLLTAARRTPQARPVELPAHSPRRSWGRFGIGLGGASLVAACVALAMTVTTLGERDDRIASLEQRLKAAKGDQVPTFRGASVKSLDTAGPFGDSRAEVVLKKDAGIVSFNKVPAPPEGMVWQVWLVDTDERITSLGIINSARKAAFLPIPDDIDRDDIERFIVTAEPTGGSDGPSAEEVVTGTV